MSSFCARLLAAQRAVDSRLCVGLDPDADRLPSTLRSIASPTDAMLRFNVEIVRATAAFSCAYKLNAAFYEAYGLRGWELLEETVSLVRGEAPHALIVLDGKRADIGNTSRYYARSAFEHLGCDALTVAPYMGRDSVEPFLDYEGRAVFVLARTSNPGAHDFQHLDTVEGPLFEVVARRVVSWGATSPGTVGLVVGATDGDALRHLRRLVPDAPFLIPGVGAQGGDAEEVVAAACTGGSLALVNSSRGILYRSSGPDFAEQAADEAARLQEALSLTMGPSG